MSLTENAISINLLDVAKNSHSSQYMPVFENSRQSGRLFTPDGCSLSLGENPTQQTIHLLRGSARMKIRHQEYALTKGHVAVIPPEHAVSFSKVEPNSLLFGLSSVNTEPPTGNRNPRLIVVNLLELYSSAERKPFMSTSDGEGHQHSSSRVAEIPIFSPEMAKERFALNGSQAARLLIYGEPITLDRHTHPLAQHAILGWAGVGSVEFEGKKLDLKPYDLFVVPPNTKHQLGSYGNFLASVINSPGIPSNHADYSKLA